jgi:hypothetical protein
MIIRGGLLAALVFLILWWPAHPAQPPLPTADLYTHLSCARHLAEGEGFQTDIAYPLSFAFPFARTLPQPMIHRGCGFPLVLTLPYTLAGGDPHTTVEAARLLQVGVLLVIVFLGAAELLRRSQGAAIGSWIVFLATHGLLVFAVDWVFEELLVGGILLTLWLRLREGRPPRLVDGLLAGAIPLFRLELFWVPVLWWIWFGWEKRRWDRQNSTVNPDWARPLILALVVLVLIQMPWAVRNFRLTGQPFFSLQAQAELVKDTQTWPDYSVYKQLEPQPVSRALTQDPLPLVRKTARGLKFYARHLARLWPWPYLAGTALLVIMLIRGRVTQAPCLFLRNRSEPLSVLPQDFALGPLAAAGFTTVLLCGLYALFDHNVRHLLVMVPILLWEYSLLTGRLAQQVTERWGSSIPDRWRGAVTLLAGALVTGLVVWLTMVPLSGWNAASNQAHSLTQGLPDRVAAFRDSDPSVIFVQDGAVTWYANRPGVWEPGDPEVQKVIRSLLGASVPAR